MRPARFRRGGLPIGRIEIQTPWRRGGSRGIGWSFQAAYAKKRGKQNNRANFNKFKRENEADGVGWACHALAIK